MSQQLPPDGGQPWNPQQPPNYSQPLYGSPPQPGYPSQQPMYPQQPPTFYPPQQSGYPQPGQMQPPPPFTPPSKRTRMARWARRHPIWTAIIIIIGLSVVIGPFTGNNTSTTSTTTSTATQPTVTPHQQSTAASKPAAVAPAKPITHYPPKTKADLDALATQGDVAAIHEFHSESTGLTGACPQPKREVTVDPALTGQKLAEDLLAYFYQNQLDSPCGSLVLAYHTQSEANDVYTAGRINFDVTDASGSVNFDPNANNLKYTLTLDTGNALANQEEYAVSY